MVASQLIQLVIEYKLLAVVLGMVIEEVIVPIPSPIIPMAAGAFLVEATTIGAAALEIFFWIALPASIASVISSYFVYGIAYKGGKPIIEKYGRYLDISWKEIEGLEHHFDSGREGYYVALFRAIPLVPLSLISGSAGLFRMDWRKYGFWSFVGMLPRNFGLAMIGWYAQKGFRDIASQIDKASTAVALGIVLLVVGFVVYRNTKDLYRKFLIE
ncbi:MAG: VTT domain-containing protein [Nanohaloarchaea archaeon]|nr:VTT domain-containing protein [Candidatus Nanohaloarchaea archaeon]